MIDNTKLAFLMIIFPLPFVLYLVITGATQWLLLHSPWFKRRANRNNPRPYFIKEDIP